jgi:hypothetical protein
MYQYHYYHDFPSKFPDKLLQHLYPLYLNFCSSRCVRHISKFSSIWGPISLDTVLIVGQQFQRDIC